LLAFFAPFTQLKLCSVRKDQFYFFASAFLLFSEWDETEPLDAVTFMNDYRRGLNGDSIY
jgi:hypothetical protein